MSFECDDPDEYVEKESFNHPYTFVAAQTGLDEKTVRVAGDN